MTTITSSFQQYLRFIIIALEKFNILSFENTRHVHDHVTFRIVVFHWTILTFPEIQTEIFQWIENAPNLSINL
mgnify:CR=1 FL=1